MPASCSHWLPEACSQQGRFWKVQIFYVEENPALSSGLGWQVKHGVAGPQERGTHLELPGDVLGATAGRVHLVVPALWGDALNTQQQLRQSARGASVPAAVLYA